MLWDLLAPRVVLFALASLRVGLTLVITPAPFGAATPALVRLAIALSLTLAMMTGILSQGTAPPPLELVPLLRAAFTEALLGSVMGLTVRVMIAAAESAGTLAGEAMGLGFAATIDPTLEDHALPTTHIFAGLAMLLFFAFDGHHALIGALAASFAAVPIGAGPRLIALDGIAELSAGLLAQSLQIAAPVVATMFIVQLGTALASRAAPRVQLFAFSFSVLVAAGTLVLWLAAPATVLAIAAQMRRLSDQLLALAGGL